MNVQLTKQKQTLRFDQKVNKQKTDIKIPPKSV